MFVVVLAALLLKGPKGTGASRRAHNTLSLLEGFHQPQIREGIFLPLQNTLNNIEFTWSVS